MTIRLCMTTSRALRRCPAPVQLWQNSGLQSAAPMGVNPQHLEIMMAAPAAAMRTLLQEIQTLYGSTESYLESVGIGFAVRSQVRRQVIPD